MRPRYPVLAGSVGSERLYRQPLGADVIINHRTTDGAGGVNDLITAAPNPVYIELQRNGDVITELDSTDGSTYTTLGTTTLTGLPNTVLIGFAQASKTRASPAPAPTTITPPPAKSSMPRPAPAPPPRRLSPMSPTKPARITPSPLPTPPATTSAPLASATATLSSPVPMDTASLQPSSLPRRLTLPT